MKNYFLIAIKYYSILGLPGVISLIRNKFFKGSLLHKVNKDCLKTPFYLRIRGTDIDAYEDVFLKEEYNIQLPTEPKNIIDAGGNIGLTAIYFANKYPGAKIFSIEPEENNFKLLKKNTAFYDQIIPIHAALWHELKDINLLDTGKGDWAFKTTDSTILNDESMKFIQSISAITIDQISADFDLKKIDLLKMDIEGAEKELFENSSSWINKVHCIIVEVHEHLRPGCLRSYYNGSNGFDREWRNGNLYFLLRE